MKMHYDRNFENNEIKQWLLVLLHIGTRADVKLRPFYTSDSDSIELPLGKNKLGAL